MMGDLISRSALLDEIKDYQMDVVAKATAMYVIRNQPTVDAVPVVHGEWKGKGFNFRCSECGYHEYGQTVDCAKAWWKFCPNCGADMRKKVQE